MHLLSLLACLWMGPLFAADFEGSSEFTHFELEGRYQVTCFGGGQTEYKTHFCRGYILQPIGNFAYFTHATSEPITEVRLFNNAPSGKVIRRKSDWNQAEGRSERRFNLWVDTLLQNPLLEIGKNNLRYELRVDHHLAESGFVEITVEDGGTRVCQPISETTSNSDFCRDSSRACGHFFSSQNNCLGN